MKQATVYKWKNERTDEIGWSIKEVWNDWDNIYSDPYQVEIPESFELEETEWGELQYVDKKTGYSYGLTTMSINSSVPCLIGGPAVNMIPLKVIKK